MKNSIIAISAFFLLVFVSCSNNSNTSTANKTSSDSTQVVSYICPMDSDVVSNKPGTCPKCGMDLEKKEK